MGIRRSGPLPAIQGQAGVHRVASEYLLRGYNVYFPSADTGVDLIVDGKIRVQVKSTRQASKHWRHRDGTYSFSLAMCQVIRQGRYVPGRARVFSELCDFVVLWAIEPNRFWIVPAVVLDRRHTVTITGAKTWLNLDVAEMRCLREQGYSMDRLAEHFGVDRRTIHNRLHHHDNPRRKYAFLHQYEGRWELISEMLLTLNEANRIVEPPPELRMPVIDEAKFLGTE